MKNAWVIAGHHLKRIIRNPGLLLLLIAIPFTLAVIMYAAFGQTAAAGKLPPIQVLILDQDDSFLSGFFPNLLTSGPLEGFFETRAVEDRRTAEELFRKNQASALIVLPEGFGEGFFAGGETKFALLKNPVQTFSPEIVESVLEMLVVIGNGLLGNLSGPLQQIHGFMQTPGQPALEEVLEVSKQFYEKGDLFAKFSSLQDLEVTLQRPAGEAESSGLGADTDNFFAYIFPGLIVFALLFISQTLALRLLRDRMRGLQTRLVITPVSRNSILWGGILYMVVGLFVLTVVLGLIASVIFRISLREPVGLLVLTLGLAVFITGLQLTITGMAKSDRSAGFAAGVIIMLLVLLGGSFVPAENYPGWLQSLAFGLPNGAAQQGIIDLLAHGKSLGEIGGRAAITWIWAAIFIGTAIRYEGRRLKF